MDDAVLARASVALARSQRLVASWLPREDGRKHIESRLADQENGTSKDGDGGEDEELEPAPERLGLGATMQKTGDSAKTLRRLMGQAGQTGQTARAAGSGARSAARSGARSTGPLSNDVDDDDDDGGGDGGGRTAVLGKRRRAASHEQPDRPARTTSFMDEVLSERHKKKKKKKKKKK